MSDDVWWQGDPLDLLTIDLSDLLRRPRWHRHAACKGEDPAVFFPERGGDGRKAKALCAGCPVAEPCRDAGAGEQGVWGGLSERDRRRLNRAA